MFGSLLDCVCRIILGCFTIEDRHNHPRLKISNKSDGGKLFAFLQKIASYLNERCDG